MRVPDVYTLGWLFVVWSVCILAHSISFILFLMSGGQKLDQHRRSKRLQSKSIGIQDFGGDTDSDIFEDNCSISEDGKAGQVICSLFVKSLRWTVL